MTRISWGAYATEESASLAKTGSARRLGSSCWCSCPLRRARPTSKRLTRSDAFATLRNASPRPILDRRHAPGARHTGVDRPSDRGMRESMHIVIMGCGRVGSTLAHILEDNGHSIAIIDRDPQAFRRLRAGFRGRRVTGVGFDRDVLIEAGIESASAYVAVSSGDNSNIISARVARETFGVDNVVARIYDPRRAEVYQRLGIPTVATVRWTA